MERCRTLALDAAASKDPNHQTRNGAEYEHSLEQVRQLQAQVAQVKSLLTQVPRDPHPILVKKSSIPYKTEVQHMRNTH